MIPRTDSLAVRAYLDQYLLTHDVRPTTAKSYRYAVNSFARWLTWEPSLNDLASRVNEYLRDTLTKLRRHSVKGYMSSLRALLRAAHDDGFVPAVKLRQIKLPDIIPAAFTHDELSRLLAACARVRYGGFLRAAILYVYDSGPRRGDALAAQWSAVDANGIYHWVADKSGKRESRQLRPETIAACRSLRDASDRLVPFPFGPSGWQNAFRRLCIEAGINPHGAGLQMVRRSAASYVHRNGGDASKFLGHSPKSGDLARRFYLDPRICDVPPPLPPPIFQ